ncbi:unnamed protein product [Vitrella brassicaformis CCMP3155]|uniref:Guanylate cyclase domain-containing protein n=1 Tax=Vitrella brassicaformis (strain CCMP3155) TaxID=1169540 RepID=A0A0G4H3V6_VITBC|nr:unnamed protein product [Vitrella brassicaformis CCMP3155]|eukprot:CEM38387.1 unnamed protein product [Vitrella brassicaformis CCMP3155]
MEDTPASQRNIRSTPILQVTTSESAPSDAPAVFTSPTHALSQPAPQPAATAEPEGLPGRADSSRRWLRPTPLDEVGGASERGHSLWGRARELVRRRVLPESPTATGSETLVRSLVGETAQGKSMMRWGFRGIFHRLSLFAASPISPDPLNRKEVWRSSGQTMHFATLEFRDADLERRFRETYVKLSKRTVEIALWGSTIFGVLACPAANAQVRSMGMESDYAHGRFGFPIMTFSVPVTGAALLLFYTANRWFLRHLQTVMAATIFLSVVRMASKQPGQDFRRMYSFVIISSLFFRLRFVNMTFLMAWMLFLDAVVVQTMDESAMDKVTSLGGAFLVAVLAYSQEIYARQSFIFTESITKEQERSEFLLSNILPEHVLRKLSASVNMGARLNMAEAFFEVLVLFSDIVGFTEMSSRVPPMKLVALLNSIFVLLDRCAVENNLEKIKTIGDAYMATGGVPIPSDTHARDCCRMGLQMIRHMKRFKDDRGEPIRIRVGVHSGRYVCGWRDRDVEVLSHGEPNRVHISLQTYQYIHHEFLCEDRGEIEVKGKGKMRTFFLVLVETPGTSARRITVSLDQAFNEGEADVEGADDADDEASRDE